MSGKMTRSSCQVLSQEALAREGAALFHPIATFRADAFIGALGTAATSTYQTASSTDQMAVSLGSSGTAGINATVGPKVPVASFPTPQPEGLTVKG